MLAHFARSIVVSESESLGAPPAGYPKLMHCKSNGKTGRCVADGQVSQMKGFGARNSGQTSGHLTPTVSDRKAELIGLLPNRTFRTLHSSGNSMNGCLCARMLPELFQVGPRPS